MNEDSHLESDYEDRFAIDGEDDEYDRDDEDEEEDQVKYVTPLGFPVYFIGAYEIDRCYGGPEEGGWWYDSGTLVKCFVVSDQAGLEGALEKAREGFPRTNKRSSVLGGEDYDVITTNHPPALSFPEERPHYE